MKKIWLFIGLMVFLAVAGSACQGPVGNWFFRSAKIDETGIKRYDVIVVGTDPEGIAAAVTSARNGMVTLLVDHRSRLGGLMTVGGLNTLDMNYNPAGELVTQGIFLEFLQQVEGDSFKVDTAEKVFRKMVDTEYNLVLKLETPVLGPIMEGNRIVGVSVLEKGEPKEYYGRRVIDATQDGDIAALAGVPYSLKMDDIGVQGENQVVTLVFELGGVNWDKLHKTLTKDGDQHTGANEVSAWGFLPEMRVYQAADPQIRMRGLNVGRQKADRVLVNAMHIFGVDPLDPESVKQGMVRGQAELPGITEHIRQNIPGFENTYLVGSMAELYIRQSRHIYGEYRLTINDLLEHVDFWDKIAFGSYPLDVQPTSMQNWGYVLGVPAQYSIPFRAIVPLAIDNLLVVGRSASYDSLAHGSTRVIPIGMVVGEAAGVASAYGVENGLGFREISRDRQAIGVIQNRLREQGAYLKDFYYPHPLEGHWALEGVRFIRGKGLISASYENNYRLDEPMSSKRFENVFNGMIKRTFGNKVTRDHYVPYMEKEIMTRNDVAWVFHVFMGEKTNEQPFEKAVAKGYISQDTAVRALAEIQTTNAVIYMMIAEFIWYLQETGFFNN